MTFEEDKARFGKAELNPIGAGAVRAQIVNEIRLAARGPREEMIRARVGRLIEQAKQSGTAP